MWSIYTMEYYAILSETMKFTGKLMDLHHSKKINLHELFQTQKDKYAVQLLTMDINC